MSDNKSERLSPEVRASMREKLARATMIVSALAIKLSEEAIAAAKAGELTPLQEYQTNYTLEAFAVTCEKMESVCFALTDEQYDKLHKDPK